VSLFLDYLRDCGRDPAGFPIRASIVAGDGGPDGWIATARKFQESGVTHIQLGAPPGLAPAQALERVVAARAAIAGALG
jgi:hypothetical protein